MFILNYKTKSVNSLPFCVFKILVMDKYRCYVAEFLADFCERWLSNRGSHLILRAISRTKPHISLCKIVSYSINE